MAQEESHLLRFLDMKPGLSPLSLTRQPDTFRRGKGKNLEVAALSYGRWAGVALGAAVGEGTSAFEMHELGGGCCWHRSQRNDVG